MEKKPGKVKTLMHEFKAGKLHSGKSGKIVKNPKQAIAIALSEAGMSKKGYAQGGVVKSNKDSSSSYKPAMLDNGLRVMVPPFISIGDKIVVKVETQEYLERAK